MRVEHTPTRARRVRGTVAAALGVLLVAVGALVPATSASAMTQVGTPPNVDPGASTTVTVQNQSAGYGTWTITAPPETRITAAQSVAGGGLGAFTCTPSSDGASASCGTSTWGAGNQVVVSLAVDAAATGGVKRGASEISGVESGTFALTVIGLAPVNRLQCTTFDDLGVTPVYGKASTPLYTQAAAGTDLGLDTKASAFPPTSGTYGSATSAYFSSYAPSGYGESTVYRGEDAIGAQSITDESDSTVILTLPYAQRLQFTLGGMDTPSVVDVTAAGPSGAVVPAGAARSTESGATTVSADGDTLHVVGSSTAYFDSADPIPEKSADVWFDQPVSSITLHQYGDGGSVDAGYVITPALGCQTGTVTTAAGRVVATDVTAVEGGNAVTYEVPVSTTVTNTGAADDMRLVPSVRTDLAARVQALGGSLDALESSSTGACALPDDAVDTGLITASSAPLAPGESCVQRLTATVTLPLAATARTLTLTSTLASSTDPSASRVKDEATATLTFPAVRSALTVTAAGTATGLPTWPLTTTFTVSGTGPDPSGPSTIRIDDPSGFPARSCSVSGLADQPSCAALLSGEPVSLGAIAAGDTRTITVRGVVPRGTPAGSTWPLTATVSSPVDTTGPHVATATFTVVAPGRPGVTSPTAGSTTTDRRPTVAGNNVPNGATVTVYRGDDVVCRATGDRGGYWSCTPSADLAVGPVTLRVTDTYGGITGPEASVSFTVSRPATPPGGATPGSGSAGGSGAGSGTGGSGGADASGSGGSTSPAPGAGTGSNGTGTDGSDTNGSGAGADSGADGSGTGGDGAGGTGSGDTAGSDGATDDGPLAMDLRFGTQRIVPGTAADMRGTLGPNASGGTVAITFEARITPGMVYRNVHVEVDDSPLDCAVATTSFSCMIPLDPGQQADVAVRVYADPINAPDTAVQQISLASNRASQANAMTVTTAVAKGATEASQLADQITTFNATEFPGAMVPLLAMLLFALAATVVGRRSSGGPDAGATASPTGTDPPEPSRASSPTAAPSGPTAAPSSPTAAPSGPTAAPSGPSATPAAPTTDPTRPTTDPPSGSNR